MIYLIGGAPRAGKSTLARSVAADLRIGWVSTDALMEVLRVGQVPGLKAEWDATPEAIANAAASFYPYLERFVFASKSLADSYLVEGVDFLPEQVRSLERSYPVRALFVGRSALTSAIGTDPRSGYAALSTEMKSRIADDIPRWSQFVRDEAARLGYPYLDTASGLEASLAEAKSLLVGA